MATQPPTSALEQAKVGAFLNGRYHADREAWFDWCHRILMFGVIVGGSSALLDVWPWLRVSASFSAVVFGTLDLVFNLSNRARTHSFLRKQYLAVAADLESPRASPANAQAEMMRLAAEEEPPYFAVHALAENWAIRAVLGPEASPPCKVGWLAKRLRHIRRYDQESFACS